MRRFTSLGVVAWALAVATPGVAQNDPRGLHVSSALESAYYVAGMPRPVYTLRERMQYYRVPAVSIAVIDDYRVTWTEATGLRDVASNAPANPTTLFQAASMSKPVAAAAIVRLFDVKHLSLDADVNTLLRLWHLPPSPAETRERVTMRRLLSHSAGTNVSGFAGYDRDAALPTLIQVLNGKPPANSPPVRLIAVPGSRTEYSGGGTTIAQQVAVEVSGQSFPAFMEDTLLGPLGMTNSTYRQPLPEALWSQAADGYYGDGKPVRRGWHVYPTMAAAGLWTTPSDLATFVIAIQNALRGHGEPPIDATVAREMTTKASKSFGLGPEVEPGYFSHNGANEGFQGVFYGLTQGGKGIVVMTNSDNGLLLADEVVHSVAKAFGWPILQSQPKRAIALAPAALRQFIGKYATRLSGESVTLDVTLTNNNGVPALSLTSPLQSGFPSEMYPESPLRFFTLAGASLEFVRDGGRVTALIAHAPAGDTTFERVP